MYVRHDLYGRQREDIVSETSARLLIDLHPNISHHKITIHPYQRQRGRGLETSIRWTEALL